MPRDQEYFEEFKEGFYSYLGGLVYVSKEPQKLVMKDPGMREPLEGGGIIGGAIIYDSYQGLSEDIDFDHLNPVDPYEFLKQKTSSLTDFIRTTKKMESAKRG